MTEKRFWLVPIDYYGEQRFVRDNTLIGEKSMSNQEVVDLLNEQEEIITEQKEFLTRMGQGNHLKTIMEQKERIKELEQENKRLKQGKYIYGIHGGSNDRK